ncbi:c-type cytochrome [Sulfitobacter aestuarii]|uniref:C-type cytochrome n=1 Tax=Sulfitobacter aestuarii TaxID=2161676 RepID=A0ABW5U110_9RHOB
MRKVLLTLLVLGTLAGLGAVTVLGLGLYNVSARAGHLPGVSWVMHSAYRNAIRLRAPAPEEVPPLDDPDLVALGARHYDSACAFCHASPGNTRSATALSMEPPPPHIETAVRQWQPEHMFQIIYEGVKMTGMPHWPAARKDEVWAIVAYLDQLPEHSANKAQERVATPPEPDDPQIAYCAACHGSDGNPRNAHVPRLDILSQTYMAQTLLDYRDGRRGSGFMAHATAQVSESDLARLATYFARIPPSRTTPPDLPPGTPEASDPGAELATRGSDDVPSCQACHGPDRRRDRQHFPPLAGQSRLFLEAQLRLWRDGARGGGTRAELMAKAAASLNEQEIEALARYYSALQPPERNSEDGD